MSKSQQYNPYPRLREFLIRYKEQKLLRPMFYLIWFLTTVLLLVVTGWPAALTIIYTQHSAMLFPFQIMLVTCGCCSVIGGAMFICYIIAISYNLMEKKGPSN
jgi:hypothetical protein